jgi:hypothetical protein
MPRKLPPHVERNHVKDHTYLSFRRGKGPRVRLPKDPTSEEFMAAYQAALLGQSAPVRDRFMPAPPGSIAALIASYMRSAEYIGLRDTSKTGYTSRLEMLRTEHGHRTVLTFARAHRHRHSSALCGSPRRGAGYSEEASDPDPSRDQHRMAEARSIIGHQAAEDQKNSVMDR